MGWNSWDCYGTAVTEAEVLANAEFTAARLRRHGWTTAACWSTPGGRMSRWADGRAVGPAVVRCGYR